MTNITGVRVAMHERATPILPGTNVGAFGVLTISTDSGVEGTAFVGGAHTRTETVAQLIAEVVRPQLIGADALDIGIIWERLWQQERMLGTVAIGAVDVALWDILGRTAGLPIHRLLGTARTTIPVYVSSWVHRRPDDYAAEALHYRSEGFGAYKIHPPTQLRLRAGLDVPLQQDIETARAVREAVGPDYTLMWDSPWVYGYEEALRFGRVLEELDYLWYEDPLQSDDVYGYERLRRHLRIPLLATEMTAGGPYDYPQWILRGATDYLRGDVAFKGGITALMKIVRTAEVFRLGFEPHDGFNPLGNAAGAHVAMAAPNAGWFEVLAIHPTGEYGFEWLNYGLATPLKIEQGLLHAPTAPGLGVEIDWDLIRSGIVAEY